MISCVRGVGNRLRRLTIAALLLVVNLVSAGPAPAPASVRPAIGDCYTRSGCTDHARSARSFAAGVGVNTHLGYSDSVYWRRWPMVGDRLIELGVSHIRDGTFPVGFPEVIGPTVAARYNRLDLAGIKGSLLVGQEQSMPGAVPSTLQERLDWVKSEVPSFTTSIEGTNEADLQGGGADAVQALREAQCELYGRAKVDPVLRSKPVIGPSAGPPFIETQWYSSVGDLSTCMDRGNLHHYSGVDPPHRGQNRDLSTAAAWGRMTYGDKPQWATETGYSNVGATSEGVSEAAAGTYMPRALLENFRLGIERTDAYELIDNQTRSGQTIDNYGLLRSDGTRKPAFIAVKRLLRIVKDSDGRSGSLGFGIVCTGNCRQSDPDGPSTQDGPIRHVLLRHSSGAYYLAVWSESKVWDAETRSDTPKPGQRFKLYLRRAPAKVEVFDPSRGVRPRTTDRSRSRVIDAVALDRVRLIKITPQP